MSGNPKENYNNKSMSSLRTKLQILALSLLLFFSCSAHSRQSNPAVIDEVTQWKHEWSRGAVFYELFVRSFQDSNGDGIGDLNGLISRLDYLNDGKPNSGNDLEVTALWLMPVFKSPSYHGYDTTDYRHINPDYGTDEDFTRLLQEAHKRGIRIIVDFVMNHSSSQNPWFLDSSSSTSQKRSWYLWRPDNPGWSQPWGGSSPTWHSKNGAFYYGVFWSGMPDLNFRNTTVRKEFKDLASYWLSRGLDGFRLDATRYLIENGPGPGQADTPETHQWLKEFSAHVRNNYPQTTMVGENWTETPIIAKYFGSTNEVLWGDELPMNFDFPLSDRIVQGVKNGIAQNIAAKIQEVMSTYPKGVTDAPFLTNHDQVRLATQLQNREPSLRTAASVLLTLPGSPFLYYGEEVGIQNGPAQGDEAKRTPMPWDNGPGGGFTTAMNPWFPFAPGRESANVAAQIDNPSSLLSHYRNLIQLRNSSQALSHGSIEVLTLPSMTSPVLALLRRSNNQLVLAAINLGGSFASAGPYTINAISAKQLFVDGSATGPSGTSGQWNLSLGPYSTGIWEMK
jgi:alpha-amylase